MSEQNIQTNVKAEAVVTAPKKVHKQSVEWMLYDVLIALAPTVIYAILAYGVYAIRNILLPAVTMLVAELVFVLIKNRKVLFSKDEKTKKGFFDVLTPTDIVSPLISGIIFGLMVSNRDTDPEGLIYFILIVSALFGIVFGKLCFGGLGKNIFNPAAVAFVFMLICFSSKFSGVYHYNAWGLSFLGNAKFATDSTPLAGGFSPSLYTLDNVQALFFGQINGGIGESCKIPLLIGMIYLLVRRDIDWKVIVSFALTFLAASLIAGLFFMSHNVNPGVYMLYELLSGGVLFGMAYMISEPVTMPLTSPSRVMYGIVIALIVVFIRTFASAPEGMAYAILMGNALGCFIDYYKWSQTKFTWKSWVAIAAIAVLGLGIFAWCMNGFNYGGN